MIDYEDLLRTPYLGGGRDPRTGLDCAGVTAEVLRRGGYELPESTWAAPDPATWEEIPAEELRPLDVVAGELVEERRALHSELRGKPVTHHLMPCVRPGVVLNAFGRVHGAGFSGIVSMPIARALSAAAGKLSTIRYVRLRAEARERYAIRP